MSGPAGMLEDMATDEVLARKARLEELAADLPFDVTTRPMMSGFIGYADGKPFVSLSRGGFGIKLLAADQEQLLMRPGAQRMRHLPDMPPSKTYITVTAADVEDDAFMLEWLELAGRTAPTPKPKKRSPAQK